MLRLDQDRRRCPRRSRLGLIAWDQDEILLLFKRGRGLPKPDTDKKYGSNHRERAGKHSAKPEFYRQMINDMTHTQPVLELFAREDDEHPLPPNFFTWGNESKNTAEIECDEDFDANSGEIIESETRQTDANAAVSLDVSNVAEVAATEQTSIGTEAPTPVDVPSVSEPADASFGTGAAAGSLIQTDIVVEEQPRNEATSAGNAAQPLSKPVELLEIPAFLDRKSADCYVNRVPVSVVSPRQAQSVSGENTG
jgi:hypothetical protein